MKTYQDLQANSGNLKKFIYIAIQEHKATDFYQTAVDADLYARMLNPTIMNFKKLLYTMSGKAVPDNYTANHKLCSNFFQRFVVQENQYLLGNGVTFENEQTKERLGGAGFDHVLQKAGREALIGGVSFGFFNLDHVEIFKITEFVPLYDEETGALMAGIRFWQIASDKPMRATLFELDGYTDFIKRKNKDFEILTEKRTYQQIVKTSIADGTVIYNGSNYPTFPIVPLWGNPNHQSELVGLKTQIDAYDLIRSGFASDLDDASMIYWTISNAGGMDDVDLAKFIEHMKRVKAAVVEDEGARAEAHTIDVPYQSRETYLSRLENDMYNDAMALNVNQIAAGNVTATAIQAAYEPLNNKTDQFEYCIYLFIKGLLDLIGVEDSPTFKRSNIANMTEETNMILASAQYLDDETILKHLPFLSPDEIDGILDRVTREEATRYEVEKEEQQEEVTEVIE